MSACVNVQEGYTHEGSKSIQVVYLKNGSLFTTGFSRMSERQYALWDGVSIIIIAVKQWAVGSQSSYLRATYAANRYCFWRRLSVSLSLHLSAQNLENY